MSKMKLSQVSTPNLFGLFLLLVSLRGFPANIPPASTPAAYEGNDYTYQAVFIYNFLKYAQWPASSLAEGEIVLGVVGSPQATEALQKTLAGKTVSGLKVAVKSFPSAAALTPCHAVFIALRASDQLPELVAKTKDKPVLLITEKPGLIHKGSCINFVTVDGKIGYEVHRQQLASSGVKLAAEVLKLAILV